MDLYFASFGFVAIFPNNLSAVEIAVRYVGPSLDDCNFASAAVSGDDDDDDAALLEILFGNVTEAPAEEGDSTTHILHHTTWQLYS